MLLWALACAGATVGTANPAFARTSTVTDLGTRSPGRLMGSPSATRPRSTHAETWRASRPSRPTAPPSGTGFVFRDGKLTDVGAAGGTLPATAQTFRAWERPRLREADPRASAVAVPAC